MPIYEYRCEKCGRTLEQMGKFTDPPTTSCPHCRGKMHRLLSSPALVFKGSGWYITDYARKGSSAAESSTSSSEKSDSSKSEASKPAAASSSSAK